MTVFHHELEEAVHESGNDRKIVQEVKIVNDQKEVLFNLIIDFIGESNKERLGILFDRLQAVQLGARGLANARKLFCQ
ncbi:MAG TPA: hypothetical protein VFS61_01305 [Anaerolineales bacterium]|nr:hypothetical protein [Anaerolineales bacterium]